MNTLYYGDDLNILRRRLDEALLRPHKGEMEFDQLPDTPHAFLFGGK